MLNINAIVYLLVVFLASGAIPAASALDFSTSQWIWTNEAANTIAPVGHRPFRKQLSIPLGKTPTAANIIIVVDNAYTLYVNGNQIAANVTSWPNAQGYCVTLRPDCQNVFAIDASNEPAAVPTSAGVLLAAEVMYSDGTSDIIVSDSTWRTNLTVPAGFEQLTYDDNSWPAVTVEGPYGMSPWENVPPPPTPTSASTLSLTNSDWIWTNENPAIAAARAFRKTIVLPLGETATSANILITADNKYSLYLNGLLVGSGSNFQNAENYTVNFQATSQVVFAIYAVNSEGPAGVIAAIQINMPSCSCGSVVTTTTDGSWKYFDGTPDGFQAMSYNDSSWSTATVEGPYGSEPWGVVTVVPGVGNSTLPGAPSAPPADVV